MYLIDDILVDENAVHTPFRCDLSGCKGACCSLDGGRGAPLEDHEVQEIERAFPEIRYLLNEKSLQEIQRRGLVEGQPGDYTTPCIDDKECVYVYWDDGIARCSFERAFLEHRTGWRKPVSCHLFPIRVRGDRKNQVVYEMIEECAPGRAKGRSENVQLADFLKSALVRKFGDQWYEKLQNITRRILA